MSDAAVDVQNLSVIFGDFYAVRDVSFTVPAGQIFGFLGANGAGKTTTIRVLCGLLPASRGRVVVDGAEFTPGRENIIKQRVGYMSQRFTLYDELSIAENFDFAAAIRDVARDEYIARRENLLKLIGFDGNLRATVRDLPGGIKQQVALSVALLHDPKIVFLDEPTAGVAPRARMRFWEIIRQLAASGRTVFVTTHYMDEAENCHRIALMRAGEIIACDSPANLKTAAFSSGMFNLTPRGNRVAPPSGDDMEACEPYGRHFHVVFRGRPTRARMAALKRDFDVTAISPSLEDVFIKLVEGDRR